MGAEFSQHVLLKDLAAQPGSWSTVGLGRALAFAESDEQNDTDRAREPRRQERVCVRRPRVVSQDPGRVYAEQWGSVRSSVR
jgi:hypothetical protein